jgi:hypothetical protein
MIFTIDMYFMLASLVAGLTVYFTTPSRIYLKLLPVFLLITFINELYAGYVVSKGGYTTVQYNIYNLLEFGFFIYLITQNIENRHIQRKPNWILWLYLAIAIANLLIFQGINTYNSVTYAIGSLAVVALSIFYFFELFRKKHFVQLSREPSFWIITGILFYFSCSFPLLTTTNFIQKMPEIILNNLQSLLFLLNIMLYTLFTIAFLCRIKIRRYTS